MCIMMLYNEKLTFTYTEIKELTKIEHNVCTFCLELFVNQYNYFYYYYFLIFFLNLIFFGSNFDVITS